MKGLERWRGGSTDTCVLLVEVPCVELRLDGLLLNETLPYFPKYPLHLLAENMARYLKGRPPEVLDLKSFALPNSEDTSGSRSIQYEGRHLEFRETSSSRDLVERQVRDCEIICISCNYSMERKSATSLIQYIREICPIGLIIVGGHDATVMPSPYLEAGADLCVLGEGETVLGDMLEARDGDELRQIRGVAYQGRNGAVRRNGKRFVNNLNNLGYPDPHLFLDQRMEYPDGPWPRGVGPHFMVVETSRGCDQACSFCSSTFVVGRFRAWCIEGMIAYLSRAYHAGVRTLLFADDNLLYRMLPEYGGDRGRRELIDFFVWLRATGFSWTFYNGLQFGLLEADGKTDDVLIEALFSSKQSDSGIAGCFEAYIPLERFDDAGRGKLPKLRPEEIQRQILECIAEQQVHQLNLGFIIGEPDDTRGSLERCADHAREYEALVRQCSSMQTRIRHLPWCSVPLPGTPNRSKFGSSIRYDLDRYPELHSNYISVIEGCGMAPIDFTLGRAQLEETLNPSLESIAG